MPLQKYGNCVLRPVLVLCLLLSLYPLSVSAKDPIVTGWVEDVYLLPETFRLRAKIDTGARHSSLNAIDAVISEREGKTTVKFTITNRYGETISIVKPVHRIATIKRHSGNSQERPVIYLDTCLGNVKRHVEVNLIDRTEFKYQMLIGRSFLQGEFVVDPGSIDLLKSECRV